MTSNRQDWSRCGGGVESHPQRYARGAGLLYLCVIVLGGLAEGLVMDALVVSGDRAATVNAILQRPQLWTLGLAANLVVPLIAVVQLWLEYLLFRPAGRQLVVLFVLLNLASLSVEAVSKLFQMMVLPLAQGEGGVDLAGLALLGHGLAFNIALLFFGAALVVLSILIWRSGYLPRVIAALIMCAGLAYLTGAFGQLLLPSLIDRLGSILYAPMLIGEASLCLWLLIMGVDRRRWRSLHESASLSPTL